MNGIIYAPNNVMEELIKTTHFEFVQVGSLDAVGVRNTLQEAARLNLAVIIIDLSAVSSNDAALLEGVLAFRIQRPNTRIIIFSPGRMPGDPLMSALFDKGIYDFIVPDSEEDPLAEIINNLSGNPATFADAVRWAAHGSLNTTSKPDRSERQTSVVSSPEVRSQRPAGMITITVAGAGSGVGCSTISLAIANYISQTHSRVALAEWPTVNNEYKRGEQSQYSMYLAMIDGKPQKNCAIKYNDVDYFTPGRSYKGIEHIFTWAMGEHYDYLILDLGELTQDKVFEMDRANLPILVTSAAPWRYDKLNEILADDNCDIVANNIAIWNIALNLSNDKYYSWFKKGYGTYLGRIIPIPFINDPMSSVEISVTMQTILQPLFPAGHSAAHRNRKLFPLFKR